MSVEHLRVVARHKIIESVATHHGLKSINYPILVQRLSNLQTFVEIVGSFAVDRTLLHLKHHHYAATRFSNCRVTASNGRRHSPNFKITKITASNERRQVSHFWVLIFATIASRR